MAGRALLIVVLVALVSGCAGTGAARHEQPGQPERPGQLGRRERPLPPDYVPVGVGAGIAYRPPAWTAAVRAGAPVNGRRCRARLGARYGAHLEIFVRDHVVAIPAGIGIEPPLRLSAGRVIAGRCYYDAVTTDPTGVIELTARVRHSLGEVFAIWGEPLAARTAGSFRASASQRLVAYVGVKRWRGDPRAIPLRPHTRVVLELASSIPPHHTYVFPPGL